MKDKLADWLLQNINQGCGFKDRTFGQAANQILALLKQEIEKVENENPYPRKTSEGLAWWQGQQKILKILEG